MGCKDPDPDTPPVDLGFDPVVHFNENVEYGTMSDVDGNEYKTFSTMRKRKLKDIHGNDSIVLVNQTWMAENLRTTRYRDGDPIALVTDSLAWGILSTEAYCNYENTNDSDSIRVYGRLYNNFAVTNIKNLAPEGWHIADTADWRMLFDTASLSTGYSTFAGGKLKEEGMTHWKDKNAGATNETGFTALPSGCREYYQYSANQVFVKSSRFSGIGKSVVFWTPNRKSSDLYQGITLLADGEGCHGVSKYAPLYYNRKHGFSVRCVKDY